MKPFLYLLLALSLLSCNRNTEYKAYQTIPSHIWLAKQPLIFNFELGKSGQKRRIFFSIRHTTACKTNPIATYAVIKFPDGRRVEREMDIYIADEYGRYLGEAAGDIWDFCCFELVEDELLPAGNYSIEVFQTGAYPFLPDVMGGEIRVVRKE